MWCLNTTEFRGSRTDLGLGIFPSEKLSIQTQHWTLGQQNINITIPLLPRRQNKPLVSHCQLLSPGGKDRVRSPHAKLIKPYFFFPDYSWTFFMWSHFFSMTIEPFFFFSTIFLIVWLFPPITPSVLTPRLFPISSSFMFFGCVHPSSSPFISLSVASTKGKCCLYCSHGGCSIW